jgi:PAS domain S-box-containing protein
MSSASLTPARARPPRNDIATVAIVGVAVYGLALISIAFTRDIGRIAAVWPANAIVLAAMLRSRRGLWPAILASGLAANIAANVTFGDPLSTALVLAGSNSVEVLLSAWVLRRTIGADIDLGRQRHLLIFLASAGVLAPLISAIGVGFCLPPHGLSAIDDIIEWYAPDALGLVMVTPALLALTPSSFEDLLRGVRAGRGIIGIALLALALAAVFSQTRYPILFLIPPALILVAFELDQAGTALALIATAVVAVIMTLTGHGPAALIHGGLSERLAILQLFLATLTLGVLPVAAALTRRRRLEEAQRLSLIEVESARAASAEAHRIATMAQQIAGIGYWRIHLASGKRDWSDHMFTLHGVDRATYAGRMEDAIHLYHADDVPMIQAAVADISTHGGTFQMKARLRRDDDGDKRIVVLQGEAEHDAEGRIVAIVGVMRDITAEETALRRIEDSEIRYRAIAENVTDMISRSGMDGNLIYLSPSVKAVMGYDPDELVGGSLLPNVHPDDVKALVDDYRKMVTGERQTAVPVIYRMRHKLDGRWVPLECNPTAVRNAAGRIVEFIDVTRDVSARVAMEAELRAARDAAEGATAVKSDFMANMSHEIRTPLTAILGFSGLLEQRGGLDATASAYLSRISNAGQSLLAIVNDVLDFSKLEAGQFEIVRQPVGAEDLLNGALTMFTPQAQSKGLDLVFSVPEPLPGHLMLDADRLRQVLLNLIGNAVKFTQAGSVRLTARYAAGRLSVEVQDTGTGLTAEQQMKLFQRFSQVDASSTRGHGGTGLGLAICKGLVEAMEGDIGLRSQPGEGSTFFFSLPAALAEAPVAEAPVAARIDLDGVRVLVADDNAINRELARAILTPFGAEVSEACDGIEAVDIALAQPFDVILMDIRMPRQDGPAAAQRLRQEPGPNQDIPILGFSADITLDTQGGAGFAFDGLVGKPLASAELIDAIVTALAWTSDAPDDLAAVG